MFFRSINRVACHRNFFYVAGDSAEFARQLSMELKKQRAKSETPARERGVAAALRAFREEWKFRAATEPGVFFWESPGNLDWVVIHDPSPALVANPLHGTILIKPMGSDPELVLLPVRRFISTIGLSAVNPESVNLAVRAGAQRICQIGEMQSPALTWHHDGWPALSSFVRYVDVEGLQQESGRGSVVEYGVWSSGEMVVMEKWSSGVMEILRSPPVSFEFSQNRSILSRLSLGRWPAPRHFP